MRLNPDKFCFVLRGQAPDLIAEMRRYIESLEVPAGFEIETIVMPYDLKRSEIFQQAMKRTNAKYKVYLAEGVFPIHRGLLAELLDLFRSDPELGIIGIAGAAYVPISVEWRKAVERFGAYIERTNRGLVTHLPPSSNGRMIPAAILSDYLLATQYDMDWDTDMPEDAFLGEVQTLRFKQAGYKAAIPCAAEPWCLVDPSWANPDTYTEQAREWFLQHYSDTAFPKVSVLIPSSHNPDMLEEALITVLGQTYRHLEVIIGDNSVNNLTEARLRPYREQDHRIIYHRNEQNPGQTEHYRELMGLAESDFIIFLAEGERFDCRKIERMMRHMLDDREEKISLVASFRQLVDDNRHPLPNERFNKPLFEAETRITGVELGDILLQFAPHRACEPISPLFRRKALRVPFGTFGDRPYECNVFMATWLSLLQFHDAIYLPDALSHLQIHGGSRLAISRAVDYARVLLAAPEYGYMKTKSMYRIALKSCLEYGKKALAEQAGQRDPDFLELESLLGQVHARFMKYTPKVSILIPAYNRPHYLDVALKSALNQTYENIEIVISDDSTTNDVQDMVQTYLREHSNIIYHRNEKPLVGENYNKCLELSSGEYINFLMDDDVFHPEKIERMVPYLLDYPHVTLVTSYRKYIDEDGNELPDDAGNAPIAQNDSILNGRELGNLILSKLFNLIGEPTTVLFRRSDLVEWGTYKGKNHYVFLNDLAAWIELMSKGDVAYLVRPLSYFRRHSGQNQTNPKYAYVKVRNGFDLIQDARNDGFLRDQRDYKEALMTYLQLCLSVAASYSRTEHQHYVRGIGLEQYVAQAYRLYLEEPDTYFCPLCDSRFTRFVPWDDKHDHPFYEFEMYNKYTAICPACGAFDRERFYKLYLERVERLNHSGSRAILHVAPEAQLRKWIKSMSVHSYICGDLYPQDREMIKLDVTDIHFEDHTFDIILCSHVLEHVPDDRKAMRELFRVLKPNGFAIVNVPIALNINQTYEDFPIMDPAERLKHFGQEDYVRIYAKRDFADRLREAGFTVEEFVYGEHLDVLPPAIEIGLSDKDTLYIVRKP